MQEIVVPFLPYEKVKNWNHNNNYYYSYDNNLARDISNWLSISTEHIIVHIVDSFVNSGGQANGIRIVYGKGELIDWILAVEKREQSRHLIIFLQLKKNFAILFTRNQKISRKFTNCY